jgi:hypothetical protein
VDKALACLLVTSGGWAAWVVGWLIAQVIFPSECRINNFPVVIG